MATPPPLTVCLSSNTAWSIFNFRAGVIKALQARGFRIVIIAPEDTFSGKLAAMGCEVHDIRIDNKGTNPWADLRTVFAYGVLYRRLTPAIALHYTIKPVIYGTIAARWLGVECINMVTGLGMAFAKDSWITKMVEWLYRISQNHPAKIFFLNEEDKLIFLERQLIRSADAEALPGEGINLAEFKDTVRAEVLTSGSGVNLEQFPISTVAPRSAIFLLVARMLREKGVAVFVEAAALLRLRGVNARCQLLGPLGVANPTAIGQAEMDAWVGQGTIEYLGETGDVRPHVHAATCVVLPSYYREGVPRSLMEAAAMGKPIITTDSVGCREVVDDGITGFLCRPRDAKDLADKMEAMVRLPESERLKMGAKGRAKMERQFDEKLVIRRYLEVIDEVLSKPRKSAGGRVVQS